MNVLVIGHQGFVGSHLLARLKADGHRAIGLGRHDGYDAFGSESPDVVINCAGQLDQIDQMVTDNLDLPLTILEWIQAHHPTTRFIQIGSSAETGPIEGARSEVTPCNPSNLYEATKLAATNLCVGFAKTYDLPICVARPFSLYGPGDKERKMIPTLIRCWKEKTEFICYPSGHDWLYIDDFIEGIIALMNAPDRQIRGEVFHFGTGINTLNGSVVKTFTDMVGPMRLRYMDTPYRSYDVMDWRADITKARAVLGWNPKVGLATGLTNIIAPRC